MLQAKVIGVKKIVYENIKEPSAARGEALIKIGAVGICGSDINIFSGKSPFNKFPQVHGHEFGGIIESLNAESGEFEIGMKVAVNPIVYCNKCFYCLNNLEYLCDSKYVLGDENTPGAMTEKIAVPTRNLVPLNDNFDLIKSPMIEPTAVAIHAINNIENSNILIIGTGTIGLLTQKMAVLKGNKIITMDIEEEFIKLSKALGSNLALNFYDKNNKKEIINYLNGEKIDLVIDTVTTYNTFEFAIDIIKKHGKILFIGIPHTNFQLDFVNVLLKDLTISPSFLYTPDEFKKAAYLIENNLIEVNKLITKIFPLDKTVDAYNYKINNNAIKIIISNL